MIRHAIENLRAADKVGLGAGLLLGLCMAALDIIAVFAVGTALYWRFDSMLLEWSAIVVLGASLPIWLLAWAFTGVANLLRKKDLPQRRYEVGHPEFGQARVNMR